MTVEQYDLQMNINTRSVFLMMKLALPHLLETKGNIVNISSVTGLRAVSTRFFIVFSLLGNKSEEWHVHCVFNVLKNAHF